ncbi:MAG: hypothetical protein HN842_11435 [Gammaproteobacteria bacterium]|jgi:DedD protein|nr:hypothetical protein [Gammaproteobacteria bacterium]MBT7308819.1 hypothetical protein [Gammaproteobacteria bacterium]
MLQQVDIKQRLVGGIVLVTLAVILIPFLMDDPHKEVKILKSNVPAWPEDPPLDVINIREDEFTSVPNPTQLTRVDQPAATPPVAASANTEKSAKPIVPTFEVAPPSSGKQWAVQVASYSIRKRKHALRFLKKMQDKGYKVKLSEVTQKGKKRLKLSTLPLSSHQAAKEMKKRIDHDFRVDKVDSMIRRLK